MEGEEVVPIRQENHRAPEYSIPLRGPVAFARRKEEEKRKLEMGNNHTDLEQIGPDRTRSEIVMPKPTDSLTFG